MKIITVAILLAASVIGRAETFVVTSYCSCFDCCGKWAQHNKTAMGTTPRQGITCAAPRSIPFGTRLNIEGLGVRVVEDRLAKRYDSRIDIYFANHQDALKFGKRTLKVSYSQTAPKPSIRTQPKQSKR